MITIRRLPAVLALQVALLGQAILWSFAAHAAATGLGVQGSAFTLNGTPTLVLGMSCSGGLSAHEAPVRQDPNDLDCRGFNSIPNPPAGDVLGAPGAQPWPRAKPEEVGLDAAKLRVFSEFVGGRGCVVRRGKLAYTWGDASQRADVASAVKPWFTHFLLQALARRQVASLDERVVRYEPRLAELNATLAFKDQEITWRHLATQTSCYGLRERPGTAFAYNDWQMALFVDLLFTRVHGTPWPEVDERLLRPLTDALGCEDRPSLVAMGTGERAGRLAISPRDFARFGHLYLQRGRWQNREVLREDLAVLAVSAPLPATLPRAGTIAAPMLSGQRTLGSQKVPDNQTDHFGSYSLLWWLNGVERDGHRHWPDAPVDTFAALSHGGKRGLAVMPSLALVVSWNDSAIDSPARENDAFRRLTTSVVAEERTAGEPTKERTGSR